MFYKNKQSILCVTSVVACACLNASSIAGPHDNKVEQKPGTVDQDEAVGDDAEEKAPANAEIVGASPDNFIQIKTIELEPPDGGWKFRPFTAAEKKLGASTLTDTQVNPLPLPTHFDIENGPPVPTLIDVISDTDTSIQVEAVFPLNTTNANRFPLRLDGNMTKPRGGGLFGGGAPPPDAHWKVKISEEQVALTAYRPQTEDMPEEIVADDIEEDAVKGPGIRINGDNDQTENDLIRVDISIHPSPTQDDTYRLSRQSDKIKVWGNSDATDELVFNGSNFHLLDKSKFTDGVRTV